MNATYCLIEDLYLLYPGLYKDITDYYPIGINNTYREFDKYSGIKSLYSIIDNNINNSKNYEDFWENKVFKSIGKQIGYEVIGATFGNVPGISGYINLHQSNDLRYNTNLYFYISLLSEYFSIEVVNFDNQKVKYDIEGADTIYIPGIEDVIVSPKSKYNSVFNLVEEVVRKEFKGYKFLPAYFDFIHIKGLSVIQNDTTDNCVSNAFFNKVSKQSNMEISGDIYYGDIPIINI